MYDGTRVKWCKDYESLKTFIEGAFGLDGKWRAFGGSSKKFDAANTDFSTIWYPGKLNTLSFNGKIGEQAKKNLINRCELSSMSDVENTVNRKDNCIDEVKHPHPNTTCALGCLNASNGRAVIDAPVPFENKQDSIAHRPAPVMANKYSHTEDTALNSCACNCGVLTAELEGVKLELVIMQNNFEIRLDSVLSKFTGEYANISQLKQDLSHEKDKSNQLEQDLSHEKDKRNQLESDLALFVREKNTEVDELNKTIASLQDRIRTVEVTNDQLTLLNMRINSETTSNLVRGRYTELNECVVEFSPDNIPPVEIPDQTTSTMDLTVNKQIGDAKVAESFPENTPSTETLNGATENSRSNQPCTILNSCSGSPKQHTMPLDARNQNSQSTSPQIQSIATRTDTRRPSVNTVPKHNLTVPVGDQIDKKYDETKFQSIPTRITTRWPRKRKTTRSRKLYKKQMSVRQGFCPVPLFNQTDWHQYLDYVSEIMRQ
jgi:hypothetical protein